MFCGLSDGAQAAEDARAGQVFVEQSDSYARRALPAAATEGLNGFGLVIGKVNLHPHLDLGMIYDDNVDISANKKGDLYASIRPGVQVAYGELGHNHIAVDYTAEIERYFRLDELDTINHLARLESVLNFDDLRIDVSHEFRDVTDTSIEVGSRFRSTQNTTLLGATYDFSSKTTAGLHYRQQLVEYDNQDLIGDETYEVGSTVDYHLSSKTDLIGELNVGRENVSQGDAGAVYEELSFGARTRINGKLIARATVGLQQRNYDSGDNLITPITAIGASFPLTPRTGLDFNLRRAVAPSPTMENNSYESTQADLTLSHRMRKNKITLYAGLSYERDDYEDDSDSGKRSDNYLNFRVGGKYLIQKWWSVGADYTYRRNDSSAEGVSFDNNRVGISTRLIF